MFVAALAMACTMFTSCDKETRMCWELQYEIKIAGIETTVTTFEWANRNEIEVKVDAIKDSNKDFFNLKSKKIVKSHKTAEDCAAANLNK